MAVTDTSLDLFVYVSTFLF